MEMTSRTGSTNHGAATAAAAAAAATEAALALSSVWSSSTEIRSQRYPRPPAFLMRKLYVLHSHHLSSFESDNKQALLFLGKWITLSDHLTATPVAEKVRPIYCSSQATAAERSTQFSVWCRRCALGSCQSSVGCHGNRSFGSVIGRRRALTWCTSRLVEHIEITLIGCSAFTHKILVTECCGHRRTQDFTMQGVHRNFAKRVNIYIVYVRIFFISKFKFTLSTATF